MTCPKPDLVYKMMYVSMFIEADPLYQSFFLKSSGDPYSGLLPPSTSLHPLSLLNPSNFASRIPPLCSSDILHLQHSPTFVPSIHCCFPPLASNLMVCQPNRPQQGRSSPPRSLFPPFFHSI